MNVNNSKPLFSHVRVNSQRDAEILERTRASVEKRKIREALASHIEAIGYTHRQAQIIVLTPQARHDLVEILLKNKQLTAEDVQAMIIKYTIQFK